MKKFFSLLFSAMCAVSLMATTVTDVITATDLTATNTTYADFSGVSKTSNAVYAGNSSKSSAGAIQMRSNNSNSGIVSTTSGGYVKSVTITVASGTKTIDVYGSNTAYSSASDLYSATTKGTKIGSVSATGTISVEGDYAYVGIRSNSGSIYLTSVSIEWDSEGSGSNPGVDPVDPIDPTAVLTVEEALTACNALADGAYSTDSVMVEGVVQSVTEISTSYGNGTFVLEGGLTVYRIKDLGNVNFTSAAAVKTNDTIVVKGLLQKYVKNSVVTPELTKGYLVQVKPCASGIVTTSMSFSAPTVLAYMDALNEFTAPELTVSPSEVTGVTYASDNEAVATVNATTGAVSILSAGTAKITASVAETNTYTAASAYYTLRVGANKPVLTSSLLNNSFEDWTNDKPDHWQSLSTASNATLTQSTDARTGSYSVSVSYGSSNMRMAYEEIILAAGTYTFTAYAKATTDSLSQSKLGYVPVKADYTLGTYSYAKDYTNLNNSTWTEMTYTFTLEEQTTLCLLVMNPKSTANKCVAQPILIDDANLTLGSTPTAIENVENAEVMKAIENGQLIIIRNGVRYDAMGRIIE